MYCKHCGTNILENSLFCTECGAQQNADMVDPPKVGGGSIGYSMRIHDPAFSRYLKHTRQWSGLFSIILALVAIVAFYIYGETSNEMDNPQALYIGLGIGGMFLLIALYSILSRKGSKTWDGEVVNKTSRKKRRRNTANRLVTYIEYAVEVRDEQGKIHELTAEDDTTVYDYYEIGDRVRHHAGLNSYEKYDKSKDTIIFCGACATLCDINDDVCWRCSCPLLK